MFEKIIRTRKLIVGLIKFQKAKKEQISVLRLPITVYQNIKLLNQTKERTLYGM